MLFRVARELAEVSALHALFAAAALLLMREIGDPVSGTE